MNQRASNPKVVLATLSLILLPLVWLWPSVVGDRTFVPFDVNQFPPASTTATAEQFALAKEFSNSDVTEVPIWFAPELELARDELLAGRLPTWNPNARSGGPLHAHGLIGLCYPPNWLALFADEPVSRLGLIAWCNLAVAGLLAFGLFRQVGFGIASAWFAAACFELSGTLAANSFFWMRLASLVWLPGVLWAMLRIAQSPRFQPLATLGLAATFAMTWLAGFPPFAATTTVFAGLLFAWLTVERWLTHSRTHAMSLAIKLFIGLALGAAWSLPQVVPSLAFYPESSRPTTTPWSHIVGQAFEPYGLLGYWMPAAFGDPTMQATLPYSQSPMQLLLNTRTLDGKNALPNYNFTEYSVFFSSLGAVLAVIGAITARGGRVWFVRAALLLAFGLGLFWPGIQLLYHLPVVQNVTPFRWLAAATLLLAWLAAAGAEHLLRSQRRLPLIAGVTCIVTAAVMWWTTGIPERSHASDPDWAIHALEGHYDTDRAGVVNHVLGPESSRVDFDRFAEGFEQFAEDGLWGAAWLGSLGALLVLLSFLKGARARQLLIVTATTASIVQLSLHGAPFLRGTIQPKGVETAAHTFLRERADELAPSGGFAIARANSSPRFPSALPPGQLMQPGIHDLQFYSVGDARTLQPVRALLEKHHAELGLTPDDGQRITGKGYLIETLPAALLRHPLFDLLSVRYALTTEPGLEKPPHLLGPVIGPEIRGRGRFFIHEREAAMPRAYVAQSIVTLADDDAVVAAITSDSLKPKRQAYVVASELPASIDPSARAGEERAATYTRNDPTHIEIDVAAGDARYLVVADTFLPGWQAAIDGRAAPLIRCNHCQRLVVLPTTACRVTMTYSAPGLALGFVLALAATVFAGAGWWLLRRRQVGASTAPAQV